MMRRPLAAVGTRQKLQLAIGDIERVEARGAEEDDGIADALTAKTGEGFGVLGHDADEAAIRAI